MGQISLISSVGTVTVEDEKLEAQNLVEDKNLVEEQNLIDNATSQETVVTEIHNTVQFEKSTSQVSCAVDSQETNKIESHAEQISATAIENGLCGDLLPM